MIIQSQRPALITSEPSSDLDRKRSDMVREVVLASISGAVRAAIHPPIFSGDEVSVRILDGTVTARVFFDERHLEVMMTAPASISTGRCPLITPMVLHYSPGRSLVTDKPAPGAATPACIEKVCSFLEGLYCDWHLMDQMEETLREKYVFFLEEEPRIREREEVINRSILLEIELLREKKSLLKRRFKNREMPEREYKRERNALLSSIDEKKAGISHEDVFGRIFRDELLLLRSVNSPRALIESVAKKAGTS